MVLRWMYGGKFCKCDTIMLMKVPENQNHVTTQEIEQEGTVTKSPYKINVDKLGQTILDLMKTELYVGDEATLDKQNLKNENTRKLKEHRKRNRNNAGKTIDNEKKGKIRNKNNRQSKPLYGKNHKEEVQNGTPIGLSKLHTLIKSKSKMSNRKTISGQFPCPCVIFGNLIEEDINRLWNTQFTRWLKHNLTKKIENVVKDKMLGKEDKRLSDEQLAAILKNSQSCSVADRTGYIAPPELRTRPMNIRVTQEYPCVSKYTEADVADGIDPCQLVKSCDTFGQKIGYPVVSSDLSTSEFISQSFSDCQDPAQSCTSMILPLEKNLNVCNIPYMSIPFRSSRVISNSQRMPPLSTIASGEISSSSRPISPSYPNSDVQQSGHPMSSSGPTSTIASDHVCTFRFSSYARQAGLGQSRCSIRQSSEFDDEGHPQRISRLSSQLFDSTGYISQFYDQPNSERLTDGEVPHRTYKFAKQTSPTNAIKVTRQSERGQPECNYIITSQADDEEVARQSEESTFRFDSDIVDSSTFTSASQVYTQTQSRQSRLSQIQRNYRVISEINDDKHHWPSMGDKEKRNSIFASQANQNKMLRQLNGGDEVQSCSRFTSQSNPNEFPCPSALNQVKHSSRITSTIHSKKYSRPSREGRQKDSLIFASQSSADDLPHQSGLTQPWSSSRFAAKTNLEEFSHPQGINQARHGSEFVSGMDVEDYLYDKQCPYCPVFRNFGEQVSKNFLQTQFTQTDTLIRRCDICSRSRHALKCIRDASSMSINNIERELHRRRGPRHISTKIATDLKSTSKLIDGSAAKRPISTNIYVPVEEETYKDDPKNTTEGRVQSKVSFDDMNKDIVDISASRRCSAKMENFSNVKLGCLNNVERLERRTIARMHKENGRINNRFIQHLFGKDYDVLKQKYAKFNDKASFVLNKDISDFLGKERLSGRCCSVLNLTSRPLNKLFSESRIYGSIGEILSIDNERCKVMDKLYEHASNFNPKCNENCGVKDASKNSSSISQDNKKYYVEDNIIPEEFGNIVYCDPGKQRVLVARCTLDNITSAKKHT